MKNFALIGAAGYIAPRHFKAIKETGNVLVAALDKFDSVGVIDSYFPSADFFVEFERFDRHLDKLKRSGKHIDYVSVCSPNYLHDSHIRFGLRHGADVICEKPLVLNPWNIEPLQKIEEETGSRIHNILQLRLHPSIISLKEQVSKQGDRMHDVDLTYITSRGNWYYTSWKGDKSRSGGIATNIGIHFFDMLTWIFGKLVKNMVHVHEHDRAAGLLQLEKANVRWFLSINQNTLPNETSSDKIKTFRSIKVGGEEIEFSAGFTDLHTTSYQAILDDQGFGIEETKEAIEIAYQIRNCKPVGLIGEYHPLAASEPSKHPFEIIN